MNCIKLNIRSVILIVLAVILNGVKHSHMAVNHMDAPTKDQTQKQIQNHTTDAYIIYNNPNVKSMEELTCPIGLQCNKLSPPCIKCDFNYTCVYGEAVNTTCSVVHLVECIGDKKFQRTHICQYCYQTQHWEHTCTQKANCNSVSTPGQYYRTNCSVNEDVLCLGKRNFLKNLRCNWTGGYRWSTALFLSITLGGFGADRFYLGHWQEGIGKLFSFGGLGVWTLIDVILISLHYLGPADGSLFI